MSAATSPAIDDAELDPNLVCVGTVCWSLSGDGIGEKVYVSRYDAYRFPVRDSAAEEIGRRCAP